MGSMQGSSSLHHQGLFMGMHWLWWLFWILVIAVVGWAFWRLARDEKARDREATRREAGEDVLRRRFSEGEIDEDEFLHRMRLLRGSRSSGDRPSG